MRKLLSCSRAFDSLRVSIWFAAASFSFSAAGVTPCSSSRSRRFRRRANRPAVCQHVRSLSAASIHRTLPFVVNDYRQYRFVATLVILGMSFADECVTLISTVCML